MQCSITLNSKWLVLAATALFVASCQDEDAQSLFKNEAVWINAASMHGGMYWVAPGLDCLGFRDENLDSIDNSARVDGGRLGRDAYIRVYKAIEAHNLALSPEVAHAACPISSVRPSLPK